mmetsp:Transcript_1735/g.6861  ORF Transcript_1735/g.6861 Transcript_1735/m.6861 type:complete len:223 (-) Transcript_1735:390-1058(-)
MPTTISAARSTRPMIRVKRTQSKALPPSPSSVILHIIVVVVVAFEALASLVTTVWLTHAPSFPNGATLQAPSLDQAEGPVKFMVTPTGEHLPASKWKDRLAIRVCASHCAVGYTSALPAHTVVELLSLPCGLVVCSVTFTSTQWVCPVAFSFLEAGALTLKHTSFGTADSSGLLQNLRAAAVALVALPHTRVASALIMPLAVHSYSPGTVALVVALRLGDAT